VGSRKTVLGVQGARCKVLVGIVVGGAQAALSRARPGAWHSPLNSASRAAALLSHCLPVFQRHLDDVGAADQAHELSLVVNLGACTRGTRANEVHSPRTRQPQQQAAPSRLCSTLRG